MNKLYVVSYCNSSEDDTNVNTQNYIKTLENNNWKYFIIGRGEVWKGWNERMKYNLNFLLKCDPTDIVVLTDARDVLCVKKPVNFIKDFKKYNKPLVVSMELYAEGYMEYDPNKYYTQVTFIEKYWKYYNIDYTKLNRKFVNNGLIAGYVSNLIKFLEWSLQNNYSDDQKALGAYINAYPDLIYADIDASLLHTSCSFVNGGSDNKIIQEEDSVTFSELCGLKSYFIHIPGIHNSKGQRALYNSVSEVTNKLNQNKMIEFYPHFENDFLLF